MLGRLPDVLTQVRSRDRFLGGAMSPDRRTMLLWENEPVLQAVDARSGKRAMEGRPAGAGGDRVRIAGRLRGCGCSLRAGVAGGRAAAMQPTGAELSRLAADDIDGLLPQVAWLGDGQLAVLALSGVVVVDRADLRTHDPIAWQRQPVPEDATMRPLGPDQLVVSGRALPVAVVDVDRRQARTVGVTGEVLAASPDGTVAAVTTLPSPNNAEVGPTLILVDTATWKPLATAAELPDIDRAVAFDADGSTIAVGTGEAVQLRDGSTGELRRELTGHNGTVMGLGFTGGANDLLWSVGRDGSAFQWDLSRQRGVVRSTGSEVVTHLADESRDGRVGVALTAHETTPNEAFLFDPQTGRRILRCAAADAVLLSALAGGDDAGRHDRSRRSR